MNILLIAIASICLSVVAQFFLKAGMSGLQAGGAALSLSGWRAYIPVLTNKYIIAGFVLYGLGAIVWLSVLSRWDVSKAYPLVGLGFVLTAMVGASMGETVTPVRILGIFLIVVGVWVVART